MKFAFIADVPWWALHREGLGLQKYGTVDGHSWDLFHCNPFDYKVEQMESYDAIRLGAASNLVWIRRANMLPKKPRIIVSLASFKDIVGEDKCIAEACAAHASAFAVVDPRIKTHCEQFGKPIFVFSDRCDHEFFYPEPKPRTGPLRVGWAGSQQCWPGVKNRELIEQACKELGLVFVRQDRELDGVKNEHQMREWYNGLDIYACANIEASPTPVVWIEAAACGIQVVGTRCGELWPHLQAQCPEAIAESPQDFKNALARVTAKGREWVHVKGMQFRQGHEYYLYYKYSTAKQHTLEVAALCGA